MCICVEETCHPRGPRKSVDFWGVDRLGDASRREVGVDGIHIHIRPLIKVIMKNKLTLLLTALLLVSCSQKPEQLQRLHVNGTALVNEAGDTVQFKGMSFGWNVLWPRFYNAGAVKHVVEEVRQQYGLLASALADDVHAERVLEIPLKRP